MKLIHETMRELSLLLFEEVRTREYIYFSYLIKEKSCFYCQLYGRVETKKKSWLSKSTILLFSLLNTKLYSSFEQSPLRWIRTELYLGSPQYFPGFRLSKWKFYSRRLSEAQLSLKFLYDKGKHQQDSRSMWKFNVSAQ